MKAKSGSSLQIVMMALLLACAAPVPASAEFTPGQAQAIMPAQQPSQLMRSLRQLQDQVVLGRPEAIAMLNRMLARIGDDMGRMPVSAWQKPDNMYAAVLYLLNGGNPEAVRALLETRPDKIVPDALVDGALAYAAGDTMRMVQLLSGPLPDGVPTELSASITLVTASQMAALDPATALLRLDKVRLDVPGTLFEEAAIRRSLKIAARLGDAVKVRLLIRNYLQRFSGSPYILDFFQQFMGSVLQLNERVTNADIALLLKNSAPDVQYALYLRLARGALVEGQTERARFMSDRAKELAAQLKADSSQAQLYSAASQVTSVGADAAVRKLAEIPAGKLQDSDRKLLKAAEAVGSVVLRAPSTESVKSETADETAIKPVSASMSPARPAPVWRQPQDTMDADLQKSMDDTRRKILEVDELLGKAGP